MPRPHLPTLRRARILGSSRRARWRRWTLRRGLAGLCAAAATLLLVGVVRPPPPATTRVLAATTSLAAGAVLAPSDMRLVEVAGDSPPVAALDDPAAVVGRRLVSRVEPGEVLTTTRLVPRTPSDGAPAGTVVAHLVIADEQALDLVSAGRHVIVYPETGGPALARDVLVLGVDTPGKPSFPGSLPGGDSGRWGLVVALEPEDLERIFAGGRPEGGAPAVLVVVSR